MKPVTLPTDAGSCQLEEGGLAAGGGSPGLRAQDALEVARHDLDEQRLECIEVLQHTRAERAARVFDVACNQAPHERDVLGLHERLEIHHLRVAASLELTRGVEHVRDAPAHAGGEIPTRSSEDDHTSARHVLAAVIPYPFDDRQRPAVSDGKAFAGDAAEVGFAASGAVERDIADEDVVLGHEPRRLRWK